MKKNNGITLIALVITIIVLLILAGVSIAMLGGTNGILGKASEAKDNNAVSEVKDELGLAVSNAMTDFYDLAYVNSNTTVLTAGKLAYVKENAIDAILTKYSSTAGKLVVVEYTAPNGATAGEIKIKLSDTKYSAAPVDKDGNIGSWVDTGF